MSDYQPLNLLNEHVKTLKDNEKRRIEFINKNTSIMYAMFESNKDYFKHMLVNVRVDNQYTEILNLLMKYSNVNHGQFDEKVIFKLLFKNGIYTVNFYKKFIMYFHTLIIIALSYFTFITHGFNKVTFSVFILSYILALVSSTMLFVVLMNSSIRFFKVKNPSEWD